MTATSFEIHLKLAGGKHDEDFDRKIILSRDKAVPVGRASRTENKQLVPSADNAWIRNPVISRSHAELSVADVDGVPSVHVEDMKSSHGTFVNREKIGLEKKPLKNGDRVQFGENVMRGADTFRPPIFDVSIAKLVPPTVQHAPRYHSDHGLQLALPEEQEQKQRKVRAAGEEMGLTFAHPEESDDSDDSDISSDSESDVSSDHESDSSVQIVEERTKFAVEITPAQQTQRSFVTVSGPDTSVSDRQSIASGDDISAQSSDSSESNSDSEADYPDEEDEEEHDEEHNEDEQEDEEGEEGNCNFAEYEDEMEDNAYAASYEPISHAQYTSDFSAPRASEHSLGFSTPFPVTPAFVDSSFTNDTNSFAAFKPLEAQHSTVGTSREQLDMSYTDNADFQTWFGSPAPTYTFPSASAMNARPSDFAPQVPTIASDAQPRATSKNEMSIDNLINPVEKSTVSAGKKRKAEVFDDEEIEGAAPVKTAYEAAVTAINQESKVAEVVSVFAEPVSKKRKVAYGLKCAAVGTVVGMVGTFATLMSLPDAFFAA